MIENTLEKLTPLSRVVPLAPTMRQVALTTIEPESHLMLPLLGTLAIVGLETCDIVVQVGVRVWVSSGSSGIKNIGIT
jgi:hypothetical protein